MKTTNDEIPFGGKIRKTYLDRIVLDLIITIGMIGISIYSYFVSDGIWAGVNLTIAGIFGLVMLWRILIANARFDVKLVTNLVKSIHESNEKILFRLNSLKDKTFALPGDVQSWIELAVQYRETDQSKIKTFLYEDIKKLQELQKYLQQKMELLEVEQYKTFWEYVKNSKKDES